MKGKLSLMPLRQTYQFIGGVVGIAALVMILFASPPVMAANHSTPRMFGAVSYREMVADSPDSSPPIVGISDRSVELTVTFGRLSFSDIGTQFSIEFHNKGCRGFTSLDGYGDVSTADALQKTLATEGLGLATACGLGPEEGIAFQQNVKAQTRDILAAVRYMKGRYASLMGPTFVRCEPRSESQKPGSESQSEPIIPLVLDGGPPTPACRRAPAT
jgi:hypothetical protein